MQNQRLRHDAAFATAHVIIDMFALNDSERNEAFGLVYESLRAMLDFYEGQVAQQQRRLSPTRPSDN